MIYFFYKYLIQELWQKYTFKSFTLFTLLHLLCIKYYCKELGNSSGKADEKSISSCCLYYIWEVVGNIWVK